jgi:hypothetical protein
MDMPATAAAFAALVLALAPDAVAAERTFGDRTLIVAPSTGRVELPIGADERIYDYGCRDNAGEDSATVTEENKRVEFEDRPAGTLPFVLEDPEESHLALKQMQVEGPMLMVWFDSRGYFPEYTAPAMLTVRKEMYGATPVSTLLATAILAGLPLLLTPGEVAKGTFGCTDRESTGKYLDVSQRPMALAPQGAQGPLGAAPSHGHDHGRGVPDAAHAQRRGRWRHRPRPGRPVTAHQDHALRRPDRAQGDLQRLHRADPEAGQGVRQGAAAAGGDRRFPPGA